MNREGLVYTILSFALACLGAWVLVEYGSTWVGVALGLGLLSALAFGLSESVLPIVLFIILALGSAYRADIAQKSFYARFIFLALIALRSLISFRRDPGVGRKTRSMSLPYVAFFAVSAVGVMSALYSVAPGLSAQRAASFLLLGIVIFSYFWDRAGSMEETETFVVTLWRTIPIILGIGYVLLVIGTPGMFKGGRLRLVLGNPNQLGHYCAFFAPIALWFFFEKARGRMKTLAWVVNALIVLSLIWSGSRAALLGTTLSLGLFFGLCYRKHLAVLAFAILLMVSVVGLMGDPAPRPDEGPSFIEENVLREGAISTGSGRTEIWKLAMRLVEKRPFLGYGFGTVDILFKRGYFPEIPDFQGGHVHNSYIEEILNLGWFGALPLFLVLAYVVFLGASRLFAPVRVTENYRLACALFSVALVGMISGIFESWFTSVGSIFCFPFWLSVALFVRTATDFCDWRGEGVKT